MRGFLAVCVVLVIAIVVCGFYLNWFTFTSTNDDRKVKFDVTVDKDKVKADEERAKEKLQNLGHQIKDEADKIRKKD